MRAGDVNGLGEAVIRLLQDATLAHRMGERGRELVKERFSEERMVQQLDELYRATVGGAALDMHWLLIYLYVFDVSFALALFFTPWAGELSFQWKYVDEPDWERKIHTEVMPLLGGAAAFCAFATNVIFQLRLHPFRWEAVVICRCRSTCSTCKVYPDGAFFLGLAEAAGDRLGRGPDGGAGDVRRQVRVLNPRAKIDRAGRGRVTGGVGGNTNSRHSFTIDIRSTT